jgi:hypothetical protein
LWKNRLFDDESLKAWNRLAHLFSPACVAFAQLMRWRRRKPPGVSDDRALDYLKSNMSQQVPFRAQGKDITNNSPTDAEKHFEFYRAIEDGATKTSFAA